MLASYFVEKHTKISSTSTSSDRTGIGWLPRYTAAMMSRRRLVVIASSLAVVSMFLAGCSSSTSPGASPTQAVPTQAVRTQASSTGAVPTQDVSSTASVTESGISSSDTLTTLLGASASTTVEPIFADTTASTLTSTTGSATEVSLPLTSTCVAPTVAVDNDGELTFVSQGKVWAVGANGTARCLYDLKGRAISQLTWSPDTKGVLLGPDQVARGAKIVPSGYLPTNSDVEWSGPNGTSLLAATAKGGLVKRNSKTSARTDISFLDRHDKSAYHPAGTGIASIGLGVNESGEPIDGIWISNNLGANAKLAIEDGSGAKLSDIAFSATGDFLYFIAEHDDGVHLHQFEVGAADLSVAFETTGAPLRNLVVSTIDEGNVAVQNGDCGPNSTPDIAIRANHGAQFESLRANVATIGSGSLTPVGWLPGERLVVLARSSGCTGPGDLHIVGAADGADQLIARGIAVAGVRSPHAIPNDLSYDIGAQVEA
jgi:hypothetical protein